MDRSKAWPKIHPCPYALRNALYRECPRVAHGFDGEPCDGCVAPPEPPGASYRSSSFAKRDVRPVPKRGA